MPSFFGKRESDIVAVMPQPVERIRELDGTITLIGGSPPEGIVHVNGATVSIAEYSFEWEGPYSGK